MCEMFERHRSATGLDGRTGDYQGLGTNWGLGTKRGTEVRFLRVLTGAWVSSVRL
jgi:hypothetical protein